MFDYNRKEDESFIDYCDRLIDAKESNLIDIDKAEIWEILFGEKVSSDHARKVLFGVKKAISKIKSDPIIFSSDDAIIKGYDIKKQEFIKEKMKVQTEKLDLNLRLRESARNELWLEQIENIVSNMKPIKVPEVNYSFDNYNQAILAIADAHYGAEFTIKGLLGEVINHYSPEVFEERMWKLLSILDVEIEKNKITNLIVTDLGDALDGLIHVSQLSALRYGQTDAIMKYAEFMATWLNELSKLCIVTYKNIKGNHSETRPFHTGRGDFPNENGERLIAHIIGIRLKDNCRVDVDETTELSATYFKCAGNNIVSCHGQYEGKIENIVSDYRDFYNVPVDSVLMGHLHRNNTKTTSSNANGNVEVIQCPSLVGINKYAEMKKLSSKAGAKLITFTDYGKNTCDIILN